MPDASRDTMQLIAGLIGHMRQIVGDGACYAMLHYGAMEEGKRLGSGTGPRDLAAVVGKLDELLQQKTEIVRDDGSSVTLRVHSSIHFDPDQRAMHGVILGLVEGALTASRAARFKGSVVAGQDELLLELKGET